ILLHGLAQALALQRIEVGQCCTRHRLGRHVDQAEAGGPAGPLVVACASTLHARVLGSRRVTLASGSPGGALRGEIKKTRTRRASMAFGRATTWKFKVVPRDGIEPPTRGFSIPCTT